MKTVGRNPLNTLQDDITTIGLSDTLQVIVVQIDSGPDRQNTCAI